MARLPFWADVYEEHLDEAEFLWSQRERALRWPGQSAVTLAAGIEDRLLAHLDALVLGAREASRALLLPILDEGGEPARLAACVYALVGSGLALDRVLAALDDGPPDLRAGAERALVLLTSPDDLDARLLARLGAASPDGRAALLRVLAARGVPAGPAFEALLGADGSPETSAALCALVAAGAAAGPAAAAHVGRVLTSRAPSAGEAALPAGLILGLPAAWIECRRQAEESPPHAGAAVLLALSGGDAELAMLLARLETAAARPAVLFALGFTGRTAAADACVRFVADPVVGPLAAEAFSAITGLDIAGSFQAAATPPPAEPVPLETEDLDADLTPQPDDDLPRAAAAEVARWWHEARPRFHAATRYLRGRPWSAASIRQQLREGPLRRAHALALDVAIRTRGRLRLRPERLARQLLRQLDVPFALDDREATASYHLLVSRRAA